MGCTNCSEALITDVDDLEDLHHNTVKLNALVSVSDLDVDRRPTAMLPVLLIDQLRYRMFFNHLNSSQKAVIFRYRYFILSKDGASAVNLVHVLLSADLKRQDHRAEI